MQTNNSRPPGRPEKKQGLIDPYYSDSRPEEGSELGAIMVHHGVIAAIARATALKVPGVTGMSSSFAEGIASMIGRKSEDRGVKVEMAEQKVNLELNIVIEYGTKIPRVAWAVQNEVRQAVEDLTGKKVGTVDVVIQGVRLPAEANEQGGGKL